MYVLLSRLPFRRELVPLLVQTSAVGILVAGLNCVFTVFSMLYMDRVRQLLTVGKEWEAYLFFLQIGRRRMFLICGPIVGALLLSPSAREERWPLPSQTVISLVVASVAFHMMTESTGGKLLDGVDYPKQWVGLMLGMRAFTVFSLRASLGGWLFPPCLQSVCSSQAMPRPSEHLLTPRSSSFVGRFVLSLLPPLADLFSSLTALEVRGIGSSIATSCQWGGNTLVGATFLSLLNGVGAAGTYAIYAGFGLCVYPSFLSHAILLADLLPIPPPTSWRLTFTFIYFCYPETSGLTLEQVGHLFDDSFGVKAAQRMRQSRLSSADVEAGEKRTAVWGAS
jgi:SP family myo-inositol transporter-like MFS transporter 13